MYIFKTIEPLNRHLSHYRRIGFVPTMGALHEGHLALVRQAKEAQGAVVSSIFVNPTQFNDVSDLAAYPRTIAHDVALLYDAGCDVVFIPDAATVYPPALDLRLSMDFGTLKDFMEGLHRPGHFEGVVQVVNRLLTIVRPTALYLGKKDYQQWRIVERMVAQFGLEVEVIGSPTVREADGLAMSSRNTRLSAAQRALAPRISQVLRQVAADVAQYGVARARTNAYTRLSEVAAFRIDYIEIANKYTLVPAAEGTPVADLVVCVAVFLGQVRLIDNMELGV